MTDNLLVVVTVALIDSNKGEKVDNALISRLNRRKKVHRNPIVWRGKYLNVSKTESGRLQPHFREVDLSTPYLREVFHYKACAELHEALTELEKGLVDGSEQNSSPLPC